MSNNNLNVAKFGGSSVRDAEAMTRSAQVALDHNAKIILVSATYGTTNQLLELSEKAVNEKWEQSESLILKIVEKHQTIAKNLNVSQDTIEKLNLLYKELKTLSRGINLLKECIFYMKAKQLIGSHQINNLTLSRYLIWCG